MTFLLLNICRVAQKLLMLCHKCSWSPQVHIFRLKFTSQTLNFHSTIKKKNTTIKVLFRGTHNWVCREFCFFFFLQVLWKLQWFLNLSHQQKTDGLFFSESSLSRADQTDVHFIISRFLSPLPFSSQSSSAVKAEHYYVKRKACQLLTPHWDLFWSENRVWNEMFAALVREKVYVCVYNFIFLYVFYHQKNATKKCQKQNLIRVGL